MAFYEMLPGAGMPSGLQAGMDSVLNKKFGTSTTYPAASWPDDVNLLGMLEEKTVSSSPIATFADGADAVPLKKCEITLPASLDGYSSVDVVHCGKNLADFSGHAEPVYSGLTITANADGSITFSGTPSRTWAHLTTDFAVDLPIGTYTLGRGASASYAMYIAVKYEDNTTENISMATSASKTFTTTKRIVQIRLDIATLNQSTNYNETVFVQVEAGATMTDFEAYIAPTTHTATLGRTIYGGSVDVVKGQGTDGYIKYVIDGVNVYGYLTGSNNMNIMPYGLNIDGTISKWLCDTLTANSTNFGYNSNQGFIFIRQAGWSSIPNVTDEATFNAYCQENPITLILPLATPETFTFDPVPIDSKLGNNTIWSEQGDTEVTYRSQGTTTPILPSLVTKTITENGTYSAEDDDADGYSEVTVNVESIAKIGINSGKLNIVNGTITADDTYCYTDPFDCPSGVITMDVGEGIVSDYAGIELIYESDGSHANYWQGASRFREVDLTNYYAATKKARLAFKKQYLSKVLLMDFGNGKIYSPLTASRLEET